MFCRHKYENLLKYAIKKAHSSRIEAKPNQTSELGQNTSVVGVQVLLEAHLAKEMRGGTNQGMGAP